MQRIVVGIDGSESSKQALHWALDEARMRQAQLDVVHVWMDLPLIPMPYVPVDADLSIATEAAARSLLDEAVDSLDQRGLPVPVERILVDGSAAETLIQSAKGADLLVVGSRGRGGFAGLLLGSVSQQVAHHAPCPLVVIPKVD
jgi:nucleotide-binding universal stress UspA family protein